MRKFAAGRRIKTLTSASKIRGSAKDGRAYMCRLIHVTYVTHVNDEILCKPLTEITLTTFPLNKKP